MEGNIRVLMITSEYPSATSPNAVPFIVRQIDYLRREGIDIDVFHFRGNKNFLNYIAAWRRLRKHTKGKKYDLMHAQWGHSAALALPKRMPWVITFRGNDLEGIIGKNGKPTFLGKILKTVSKVMARMADEVIVVSESLARNLKRKDFHVIPSGLDLEIFKPIPQAEARKTVNLPSGKKLILFAAAAIENPRKRYGLAKAAVELLRDEFDAELIVATGVSHKTIPVYMNACDVLLLTSVHEGSPNVVKEAIACNLPVVSVDVGDVRARIEGIEGCLISESETPEAIAESLKKVLKKGGRIEGNEVIAGLDERITSKRVIEVYKRVLALTEPKTLIANSSRQKHGLKHSNNY